MSCRHLAPRGREARYSPPNRHTCIHTRTHTPNVVVCVPVGEWNMELHVHTQLLCMALYGCAGALHDVFVLHYYCVPVSWCCLSISPWSQSALAGFIEATDSVGTHTHTRSHTHTRTSSEQPWSQADRDRQRLGEVERTAWGCLQTRGNTPPSHRNSGVEAKNSNSPLLPFSSVCLLSVIRPISCLIVQAFSFFLFLPLHLFNNLYVLFFVLGFISAINLVLTKPMHQQCNFVISTVRHTNQIGSRAVMHVIHQNGSVGDKW